MDNGVVGASINDISTGSLLKKIWGHLGMKRRVQVFLLLALMILSGFAELFSLGAVIPLLAILSSPEGFMVSSAGVVLSEMSGINNENGMILLTTSLFIGATLITAGIRLSNLWLNGKVAAEIGSDISCEAYRRAITQPYSVQINRNTSSLIVIVTQNVAATVASLTGLLQLITAGAVAVSLFIGLVLVNTSATIVVGLVIASVYVGLALTTKKELAGNSRKITVANESQVKGLQEGLGAIRDVILESSQDECIRDYKEQDRRLRRLSAKNLYLASFPRFTVEAIGMGTIALMGCILILRSGSSVNIIPLLGTFALGAQRLLPALQLVYSSWAVLKGCHAEMLSVTSLLDLSLPVKGPEVLRLGLRESITLKEIGFSYKEGGRTVLRNINLEIKKGEKIGIVGETGSGKSTLVDIVMGLLSPSEGRLIVDGVSIFDERDPTVVAAWRKTIGHVPQTVYLADRSIAENIAFGVPEEVINIDRIRKAAKKACIADFIESTEKGYMTLVGERGVLMSGGQRQRIGIARALYKEANVLILDEATSALDIDTERNVMKSIEKEDVDSTIIIVAHRLSTLENCDRVFRIEDGYAVCQKG